METMVSSEKKHSVSYLIALYNKEEFIEECIESILAENSNKLLVEICIVDDGSTDNSLKLVKARYSSNPHIKIANFPKNKGKNAAYNRAFDMSTGEYICIFGADDIVVPGRTIKLLNQSRACNKSIYGKHIKLIHNKDSLDILHNKISKISQGDSLEKVSFDKTVMHNTLSGGVSLLLRSHIVNIFPIPEHLTFEDWWIAYYLTKEQKVMQSEYIVTFYRIHDSNDYAMATTNRYDLIKRDYLRHSAYLNEFLKMCDSKKESRLILKSMAIRDSFLGKRKLQYAIFPPFDKSSLKILIFSTIGAKRFYNLIES